jgi:hypothetical protein
MNVPRSVADVLNDHVVFEVECREIGYHANRRLLGVQRLDHDPITGARDLHTLTDSVTTDKGTRIPGLRLGQQRSHALLSALLTFRLQPGGFTNMTFEPSPPSSAGCNQNTQAPARSPTTCDAYVPTASSRRSPIPTAPASPTTDCTPRCSSPASMSGSCPPDWLSLPTVPHPIGYVPPPPPTTGRSTTSATTPDLLHEHHQHSTRRT